MKNQLKLLISLAALAILLSGGTFIYNKIFIHTEDYTMNNQYENTIIGGAEGPTAIYVVPDTVPEYHKISPEDAKLIMDNNSVVLLDVRTQDEYHESHIDGAVLIPDTEIGNRAERELPDKDAVILVYCRSGRRSAEAAKELVAMGYTAVYDFGGIIDWPYETVK